MIIDKLKNTSNFTTNEQGIAEYILQNLESIPNMSAKNLAKYTYTSKAGIVRLSKKLGFKGFSEFKLKLLTELNQYDLLNRRLVSETINDETTIPDILNILPSIYDKSIISTQFELNDVSLSRLKKALLNIECINIYGTGISYYLAQSTAFKISTLGIDSSAYESINTYKLSFKKTKKVSIVISFTGANRTIKQMVQYLDSVTDDYIIGILGPHNKEIKAYCDEVIEIINRDSILNHDVIKSFISANYILDCIFMIILANNYKKQVEVSKKYISLLVEEPYGISEVDLD